MTTSQQLHHLVHHLFAGAMAGDAEVLASVERFEGSVHIDAGDLLFTLPDLFRLLLIHCEQSGLGPPDAEASDYLAFRRTLYGGNTNTLLRAWGAVVVVERAEDDHAQSLYRLTRLKAP